MEPQTPPKANKQWIYVAMTITILLIVLNLFMVSGLEKNQVTEVDYKTFITMLEKGSVESVLVEENRIQFTALDNEGKESPFVTGRMEDPQLTDRLLLTDVKFEKEIVEESSPLFDFILTWILPLALLYTFWGFLMRRAQGRVGGIGSGSEMKFGKSNVRIYAESETGKTFKDVAGQDEAKEALWEVIDFLHNPEKYRKIGAKMPKGILLVGPPGTGKTLLAKAVAGEAKVPFFSISGSEFMEMFVGVGAARVRDLFDQAQAKAPCIVFIDEIDTIGKSRNVGGFSGNDERDQTLNQLLNEMDGFSSEKGVVILAATNKPEVLDKALLRPGRFDRRIPLELPDITGREAVLDVHAKSVKMDEDINLKQIARDTSGSSGADLANLINEGALHAIKEGRSKIKQSDLEYALEIVLAGYQRKNAILSKDDKKAIAYHEIGHAIVAAKQTDSAPVNKISIIPRTSGVLGYTMQTEETDQLLMSREKFMNKIITYMGGRSAEEVILNTVTSGAENDIEAATKIARAMVTRYGMSEKFDMMALETVINPYLGTETTPIVSNETSAKIDDEVLRIIKFAHERAKEIIRANEPKLHELAKYLLEKETISGEEFMEILMQKE
ncbi:peptidase m41 ftsh extracellular [Trichococcus palustris]|jgi:cell division protease FtsH|uniref:ATP-dependent zinc metalloprotease FtsH n=1 Tax=Trichococcus palustris TaxID=140314 RepID=A0A143YF50_9LACT|nr:ATP-dependent zinc metalloprotease FtsH [Trichococcus palustris]CZQ89255.1 peptidase m41 ftsh extracellular [Trichococcus palustris]SFL11086.1 cell division protease FtsH [Trichococcus palustris]